MLEGTKENNTLPDEGSLICPSGKSILKTANRKNRVSGLTCFSLPTYCTSFWPVWRAFLAISHSLGIDDSLYSWSLLGVAAPSLLAFVHTFLGDFTGLLLLSNKSFLTLQIPARSDQWRIFFSWPFTTKGCVLVKVKVTRVKVYFRQKKIFLFSL